METYTYVDSKKKIIMCSDGRYIPVAPGNRDYDLLIASGAEILDYAPTLEDQLAAIEAKYAQKQAELDKALVAALRMDGTQEASARAAIKQKSLKLIQDQNDEIDALVAQQNGG